MHALPPLARLKSDPEDQQDENESEEEPGTPPDNQTLLRLLEENEKVIILQYFDCFILLFSFRLVICLGVQEFKD